MNNDSFSLSKICITDKGFRRALSFLAEGENGTMLQITVLVPTYRPCKSLSCMDDGRLCKLALGSSCNLVHLFQVPNTKDICSSLDNRLGGI